MYFSLRDYLKLTKSGIVFFALVSAGAGYTLALHLSAEYMFSVPWPFLWLLAGLYLVVSGSFALNQSYEWRLDRTMKRTQTRPVPCGKITALQAFALGISQVILGLLILLALKPLTAGLALLAVLLYNLFYTVFWKKKWVFAPVPGALPGALPVMIGYSVPSSSIFSIESLYLFFILFLWQMPHFWSLALHYKKDYQSAGIPVLPLNLGLNKTFYYIGFYLLSYLGLALLSPLFFKMNVIYIFILIPFCIKVFLEFIKFSKKLNWKPFFIWLNLSVLLFLWGPVFDLWIYSAIQS
ncbi:MAG: protoheme IX farnesyltransferase [Bdellovibrionales bacterium]|nr:protoheme IX farnesyltransferase [Bdellovibrionales bacterium]